MKRYRTAVLCICLVTIVTICLLYSRSNLSLLRRTGLSFDSWKALDFHPFSYLSEENKLVVPIGTESFDVYEALKRDGYKLTAVSATKKTLIAVSEIKNKILDSANSTKNITLNSSNSTLNRTLDSSNSTLNKTLVSSSSTLSTKQQTTPTPLQVPNVVHYVFLGSDLTFTFSNYLSYRSVERFIQPEQIFIHGDNIPTGRWWNRTIAEVNNIYHVKINYSSVAPNGQPYKFPAHISDYLRTSILLRYGGIYLDADVLVVKSFTPLRQYPAVMGREVNDGLCNGIIIAKRGALFLGFVLEQYGSYYGPKEVWAEKSVINTDKLARLYPHLIHVEET